MFDREALSRWMKANGFNQLTLAAHLRLSRKYVHFLYHGKQGQKWGTFVERLHCAFPNQSIDYFFKFGVTDECHLSTTETPQDTADATNAERADAPTPINAAEKPAAGGTGESASTVAAGDGCPEEA